MTIQLHGVWKRFGSLTVFEDLSISFPDGEITALLGPSGSGKTTLLNILAGTQTPDAGTVDGLAGQRISYIFQDARLLPWSTVEQNIDFVLHGKMSRADRQERIENFLSLVGLQQFRDYYPSQLSGGMRQRVSIARAFAYPGEILLMDEPFKGLDLGLKLSLLSAFVALWKEDRRTTVFVTHDIQDALLLGNEIAVLSSLPAKILRRLRLHSAPLERSLDDPRTMAVEKELYRLFLHSDPSC